MDVTKLLRLESKIILVTGGAGLYGKFIVEGLVEAGGTVISASRDLQAQKELAETLQAKGYDVVPMRVDQADHQSVLALKQEIEARFGRLDVFVNNSVARPMRRYTDDLDTWKQSMDINASGMFDIVREMAELIGRSGGGSIVNIGSMQGMFAPDFSFYEGTSMYSPPDYHFHKGGMITLTKYLARLLGPEKIRVNCVSPGGLFDRQDKKFLERYIQKVPLGRMAEDDDIKGVVVFLASDASAYITGANILMDGGLHA